ncbi:MAG TPA: hypothetical protein VLF63_01110 [Patescibacteria group bacterium]|nr:hypothetical protein [Patescibacteria group bacterium]
MPPNQTGSLPNPNEPQVISPTNPSSLVQTPNNANPEIINQVNKQVPIPPVPNVTNQVVQPVSSTAPSTFATRVIQPTQVTPQPNVSSQVTPQHSVSSQVTPPPTFPAHPIVTNQATAQAPAPIQPSVNSQNVVETPISLPISSSESLVISGDFHPTAPATPISTNVQTNDTSLLLPKSNIRKILMPLLIVFSALVMLSGGAAAVYFGIIVPNKPENILKTAVMNSLNETQVTATGTATDGQGSIKLDFTSAVDTSKKSADISLNATYTGINFPIEMRYVKQNLYFKIGDLSSISGVIGLVSPDAGTIAKSVSSQVSNKWISVDSTIMNSDPTAKCVLGVNWGLSKTDIKYLKSQYVKHPFSTILSSKSDKIQGKSAEKYVISVSDNGLSGFGDSLKGLSMVKAINKCPGVNSQSSSNFRLTAAKIDTKSTQINVWVDKATKHISQIAYNNPQGTMQVSLSYKNVNISAPTDATPVLSFIGSLENSIKASGIDPNQLFSSGLGQSQSTNSDDAKRQTNMKSLQTQLEAFFSEQGYYPSRADMNNSSWLDTHLASLDRSVLQDPQGTSKTLASLPAAKVIAYQPTTSSGVSCENNDSMCAKYKLTATLSDGSKYTLNELD